MKQKFIPAIALFFTLALLCSCTQSGEEVKKPTEYIVTNHFEGQQIGLIPGTVDESFVNEDLISPIINRYETPEEGIKALRDKKIEGMILPAVYANNYVDKNDDLVLLFEDFIEKRYSIRVKFASEFSTNYWLLADATLSRLSGDGTMSKLLGDVFDIDADKYTPPENYKIADGRKLIVAIDPALGEKIVQVAEKIALEIAKDHVAELVIEEMPADKMNDALLRDEIHLAFGAFDKEDELPHLLQSTEPFFDDSTLIVIRNTHMA